MAMRQAMIMTTPEMMFVFLTGLSFVRPATMITAIAIRIRTIVVEYLIEKKNITQFDFFFFFFF